MSSFRIDPATGELVFPELGVKLPRMSAWQTVPEVLRKLAGPDRDMRTGWIWRTIQALQFEGHPAGLASGECEPPVRPTEEECQQKIKVLTAALEAQLGVSLGRRGEAYFPWGSAYCGYDPKGGFTSAGINYTYRR